MQSLTARQLQVARLIADGYTNAEIAERLQISASAVKQHSTAISKKLGAPSRRRIAEKMRKLDLLED